MKNFMRYTIGVDSQGEQRHCNIAYYDKQVEGHSRICLVKGENEARRIISLYNACSPRLAMHYHQWSILREAGTLLLCTQDNHHSSTAMYIAGMVQAESRRWKQSAGRRKNRKAAQRPQEHLHYRRGV